MNAQRSDVRWSNFVRHVRRRFNTECDELAGQGKVAEAGQLHVQDYRGDGPLGRFWHGAWDGGFDPGQNKVGVGWKIWNSDSLTCNRHGVWTPNDWKLMCCGYGAVEGEGATFGEMMAFQCLLVCLLALANGQPIDVEDCLGIKTVVEKTDWSNQLRPAVEKAARNLFSKKRIAVTAEECKRSRRKLHLVDENVHHPHLDYFGPEDFEDAEDWKPHHPHLEYFGPEDFVNDEPAPKRPCPSTPFIPPSTPPEELH